jgi:hypothetical protein
MTGARLPDLRKRICCPERWVFRLPQWSTPEALGRWPLRPLNLPVTAGSYRASRKRREPFDKGVPHEKDCPLRPITALALSLGATAFTAQPVLAQSSAQTAQTAVDFPINLNTATDERILAVPDTGPRFLREFK